MEFENKTSSALTIYTVHMFSGEEIVEDAVRQEPEGADAVKRKSSQTGSLQAGSLKTGSPQAGSTQNTIETVHDMGEEEEEEEKPKPKPKRKRDSGYTKSLQEAMTNLKIADNKKQKKVNFYFTYGNRTNPNFRLGQNILIPLPPSITRYKIEQWSYFFITSASPIQYQNLLFKSLEEMQVVV